MALSELIGAVPVEELLAAAPVFIVTTDGDGRITDANGYACDLTGRDPRGEYFRTLVIDFSSSFDLAALAEENARGRRYNVGTFSGLPQTLSFDFHRLDSGYGIIGVLDVKELELMRTNLLGLNNELNALTREVHKKNAELEQLNRLKNRFLGMAAHDLRKPCGIILNFSEFLQEEAGSALSEEHTRYLEVIRSSSRSMSRLIDDFLDISIIESGKLSLNRAPRDIMDIIREAAQLNLLLARRKQVSIEIEEASIPPFPLDRAKIIQVLDNLLSNAIEFSPPGSRVEVRAEHRPSEGLTVSVKDAGPGVDPTVLRKLFEPFNRGGHRKSSGEKSIGLGLVISRAVIQAHGGTIGAENVLPRGALFSFFLPGSRSLNPETERRHE